MKHRIAVAVIAGDGIGQEVIPAGIDVVQKAAAASGASSSSSSFRGAASSIASNGRMMDADGLDRLQEFDAIYLGAIGDPSVPDHVSVWELILPIRQRFDQYVNLRPMRLLPGVHRRRSPGAAPADIDMVCVRENSEGEYAGVGGRLHAGTPHEVAEQTERLHAPRHRADRAVTRFELAPTRPRKLLASATKSNALQHSMVLWDEVVEDGRDGLPDGRRGASTTSTRWRRAWSPIRPASTSSSRRTCSATS